MKTVTDTAVNVIKTRQKELEETKRKNVAMQTQIIQAQGKLANSANAEDIKIAVQTGQQQLDQV